MPPSRARKKPITLREIAAEVGVSINTVSSVLNPRSAPVKVGANTRRQVIEAARRLGYRRNAAASRMGGGQTRTIGILLERITHPINAPIADGFEQEVQRLGYQCFIGCTRGDGVQKMRNVERFLEHDVQGMLLTTIWDSPEAEEALKLIFEAGMPVVYADYRWDRYPAPLVCGDHFQGGQLLARHLLEVGHRRMLFLSDVTQLNLFSVRERIRGFRETLAEAGLPPGAFEVRQANMLQAVSKQAAREDAARVVGEALAGPEPPSIVACGNDFAAWILMHGLMQAGLRVPNDVAVTGYDDLLEMLIAHGFDKLSNEIPGLPGHNDLTTISQPLRRVGIEAAQVLIEQIEAPRGEDDPPPPDHLLEVNLVVRGSSRLPDRCR